MTAVTTKMSLAAEAERMIATQMQEEEEEEEEEAEIIRQSFFLTPAPSTRTTTPAQITSFASANLKLDKHTTCMW